MKEVVLTIDQGTSSTKVSVYSINGELLFKSTKHIPMVKSSNNFIEQRPVDILDSIQKGIEEAITVAQINPKNVVAVGMDNQGETIIPFKKNDLTPLYNAVSWQDGRGEEYVNSIKNDNSTYEYIKRITGVKPNSYFSGSKMEWLISNIEEIKTARNSNNLIMATSEVWLINKLINKKLFRTDYTTASRTMLLNIETLNWDDNLISLFHLTKDCLPETDYTNAEYGVTNPTVCSGIEAPLITSVVDQQASLFGHRCFNYGEAKLTLGTGGFLQVHSGKNSRNNSEAVVKSLFPKTGKETFYISEGQVYSVGSSLEWLKRCQMIDDFAEVDILSKRQLVSPPLFIPALSGASAPYWNSKPFAGFLEIGLQTTKTDLIYSVLEGIAFRSAQIIMLVEKETGIEIRNLSLDGGVSQNKTILNIISAVTKKKLVKPINQDLTSIGVFFLESMAIGIFSGYEDIMNYSLKTESIDEPMTQQLEERFNKWENYFAEMAK